MESSGLIRMERNTNMFKTSPSRIMMILSSLGIVWMLLFSLFMAWNLTVEYYDGYDNLNSASVIGRKISSPELYSLTRPPMVPLLYSWIVPGPEDFKNEELNPLRLPHCFAVCLSFCCLVASFAFLRTALGSASMALLGVFLISQNRLFIHQAPFAGTDIPTTLFVTLGLWLYLKAQSRPQSPGLPWLCGGCFAFAALSKFGFWGALIPLTISWLFLGRRSVGPSRTLFWPVVITLVFPGIFLFCFYRITFGDRVDALSAILNAFYDQLFVHGIHSSQAESPMEYFCALRTGAGWIVTLLALLGIVLAFRDRSFLARFLLIWTFSFGGMLLLAQHKEPRYLLPLIPVFYLWALSAAIKLAAGMQKLMEQRTPFWPGLLTRSGLLVLLASASLPAAEEYRRFQDPVYFTPFTREIAKTINHKASPTTKVFWYPDQRYYTLRPTKAEFCPGDDYFYCYHLCANGLSYFLNRKVEWIEARGRYRETPMFPGMLFFLKEKDIAVITSENYVYCSHNPLNQRHSLAVGTLHTSRFIRQRPESGAAPSTVVYANTNSMGVDVISFNYEGDWSQSLQKRDGRAIFCRRSERDFLCHGPFTRQRGC
jgi:hypothetical protein